MKDSLDAEYATQQEVNDFIGSLFTGPNPTCDPKWDLSIPTNVDLGDVEFATEQEVDSFITGLFKQNN